MAENPPKKNHIHRLTSLLSYTNLYEINRPKDNSALARLFYYLRLLQSDGGRANALTRVAHA